jgi:hypothetical protein
VNAQSISARVKSELLPFSDTLIKPVIEALLIAPRPILRSWDYGQPDQQFVCWQILEDPDVGTGIAFCEEGFGPNFPWGLVSLGESDTRSSMGMDSAWFPTFLDAYFDSFSATRLPIYQVVQTNPDGTQTILTQEGEWDEAWAEVEKLRSTGEVPVLDLTTLRHSHPTYDVITRRYPRP